jgi:sulfur dioxygenase
MPQEISWNSPASPVSSTATSAPADAKTAPPGYAGDVTPEQAFEWTRNGEAVLVDVRTDAEREWVGRVPGAVPVAWKQWPAMQINPEFDAQLRSAVPVGGKVVLLCRSGVRSVAAARRAAELGIEAYNILEGFEGNPDAEGHRNRTGGWRFRGLPWSQG